MNYSCFSASFDSSKSFSSSISSAQPDLNKYSLVLNFDLAFGLREVAVVERYLVLVVVVVLHRNYLYPSREWSNLQHFLSRSFDSKGVTRSS